MGLMYRVFVSKTDSNRSAGEYRTLEEAQSVALEKFIEDAPNPYHPFAQDQWDIVTSEDEDENGPIHQWRIDWISLDPKSRLEIECKSYVVEWPSRG